MKRILMIAYHFPPLAGSSGIQRTLRFVQHLPKFGWEPIVLTADSCAYERTSDDLTNEIPKGTVVSRAYALDTARHLSVKGRYIAAMARPDRWVSWKFDGVRQGMKLIEKFNPQVIWSTYPIPTAHLIGKALHRKSGLPWVADFRDPMAQDGYPVDQETWRAFKNLEETALAEASLSVFTTPGAARTYRQRYPAFAERVHVVENGYDEETFADLNPCSKETSSSLVEGAITLLHSGIVYPDERDPTRLFEALAMLDNDRSINPMDLKVRFRAPVHDNLLLSLAKQFNVEAYIEVMPPIPYKEALIEMLRANGLLVMQASGCNEQIPAKVYEYLRAGRPILALTDPAGDTATTLMNAGVKDIANLHSAVEIAVQLNTFVSAIKSGSVCSVNQVRMREASREGRTKELVTLLNTLQFTQ
jgi:glycosyltransferase involved in cell wall biosynthesis